jgi:hypothetical protein
MARMISTSCIKGTGFMKCMPTTRSGCGTQAAMRVSEMDEVLDARMASARVTLPSSRKMDSLMAGFSVAASTTRSRSARSASWWWMDARQDAGDVGFGNAAFLGHARQAVANGGQALCRAGLTSAS